MAKSLGSNVVSLEKGDTISLEKVSSSPNLTKVTMGLGWDPAEGVAKIDLDASALLFNGTTHLDTVFFNNLSANGVTHNGDNRTGEGDGDDETVDVDLAATGADTIAFVVTSYEGQPFGEIANAYCRLVDASIDAELARAALGEKSDEEKGKTAVILAVLQNVDGKWEMTNVAHYADARVGVELVSTVQGLLA